MFPFFMQPTVQNECIKMLSLLALPNACRPRAKRYAETVASIATLGNPYMPDSPSMKHTLYALMMTDFMEEISRMRMEYATCVGK
jgi:hypothetical protein